MGTRSTIPDIGGAPVVREELIWSPRWAYIDFTVPASPSKGFSDA